MPQIEVSFDLDANGILNVSAKNKATGKEQSIVIKASSGLSDEEIEQMVRDAEAHAADDEKFAEMVNLRNQADAMIHASRKAVKDAGDKVGDADKEAVESAATALDEALKSEDKAEIEAKMQALTEASAQFAQKAYADASAAGSGDDGGADGKAADGDAVDAEFEEVKDDDKKDK